MTTYTFPPFYHRTWLPLAGLLLLITTLSSLLAGCTESAATETAPSPPTYLHRATSAELTPAPGYSVQRSYVGRIQVQQDAHIGFEQAGKVAQLFVNEGETVSKGELLARQDTELLSVTRQELDAQQQQINADLALVEANLTRLRSLKSRGFTSAQSLDELKAQRKVLQANRKRTQASIHGNELRIRKSSLLAPYDAVISRRLIDEGEVVDAGSPALTLLQRGHSEVKVGIPVTMLTQLADKQQFSVRVDNARYPVRLLTRGFDVDPTTRTVQLRFELLDNPPLVNGQLAWLQLEQYFAQPGYWVPLTALTDGIRGLWNLYTLQPNNDNNWTVQSRNVRVFHSTLDKAFIYAPLIEGERFLTKGLQRLVPDQRVRLDNALASAATAGETQP